MFESVEQLEREVNDFRQNILASSKLIKSIEDLTASAREQNETLAAGSSALLEKLDANMAELQKSHTKVLQKQMEESRVLLSELTKKGEALLADMQQIPHELDKHNSVSILALEKSVEQFQSVTKSVIEQLDAVVSKLTVNCDTLLKAVDERNSACVVEMVSALTEAQRPYLQRMEIADASIKQCESQLDQKHQAFLSKLEATNVEQLFQTCQDMKKSMDAKFLLLSAGMGISIALMIVSLFVR